jgi:superfamily I DNA/RNA helicase
MPEAPRQVALADDALTCMARLPKGVQPKVAKFILRFRNDPAAPGINYEKIEGARDDRLRSVRIDQEYRGIILVPARGNVYVLLWIDKHDDAYQWAANKTCRVHDETGVLQVYTVDADVNRAAAATPSAPGLFADLNDRKLKRFGVPKDLIGYVRSLGSDGDLEAAEAKLPADAYEALFLYAAGYSYDEVLNETQREAVPAALDPEDYAAALTRDQSRRKFWVVEGENELEQMLEEPLETWRIFLHPSQRRLVRMDANGPVRVLGGPGTGKTVAAVHRARHLAEQVYTGHDDRILLTTFTVNLAADIRDQLERITAPEAQSRIEVINLDRWVQQLLKRYGEGRQVVMPGDSRLEGFWREAVAMSDDGTGLTQQFFQDEWRDVVQAQGITERDSYLRAPRQGRGTRLNRRLRSRIWQVFETYRAHLDSEGLLEPDDGYSIAAHLLGKHPSEGHYSSVVVDEAQDMGMPAFRLLRALVSKDRPGGDRNSLYITGDPHQRIYRRKVTLSHCGIDIQGRGTRLKLNYRTSAEIKTWALALLRGVRVDDLDTGEDDRRGYRSLFHGPEPHVSCQSGFHAEIDAIQAWIDAVQADGLRDQDICLLARTRKLRDQVDSALRERGYKTHQVPTDKPDDRRQPGLRCATMHRAKGLEFYAVGLTEMNRGVVPLSNALEDAADDAGRADAELSERLLVYVAATRAKKRLGIFASGTPSSFLDA